MTTDTKVSELPELPEPDWKAKDGVSEGVYSAQQVRDFGMACYQAALARQGADKKAAPAGQEIAGWEIYSETGRYVTYVKTESKRDAQLWRGDDGELPEWKAVAVYAAPPAQAVDLGQFRVLADFALSYASHVYYSDVVAVHRLKCAARALIDQQASKAGGGA